MRLKRFTGLGLGLGLTVALSSQPSADAAPRTLQPFPLDAAEITRRLEPLLSKGEVILLESSAQGTFSQASVFASVPVSAEKARALISEPANYKPMSPSVDEVTVEERSPDQVVFVSRIEVPFGHIATRVRMRLNQPEAIYQRFEGGDLETGAFRWIFVPGTDKQSHVAYTLSTDIRETSWMLRQLVDARPEMQYGGNAGTGLITVWGLRRLALGESMKQQQKGAAPWANKPVELPVRLGGNLDAWQALKPVMQRGPLIHVESTPAGRLKRVTVYGLLQAPEAKVRALLENPSAYPTFLTNYQAVVPGERKGNTQSYRSTIEIAMFHYTQDETLTLEQGRYVQRVVAGDLAGTASAFEVQALSPTETLGAYTFYLDPSKTGWVMRKIFELDPLVEHVMAVSGGANVFVGLARAAQAGTTSRGKP